MVRSWLYFYLVLLQAVCFSPLDHVQSNAAFLYSKGLYPKLEQLPGGGWCACPELNCWLLAKCLEAPVLVVDAGDLGATPPRLKITDVVSRAVDQVLQPQVL